jgi:L-rhamnose mutarotase
MRRFGQTIKLKPGKTREYKKYHAEVWPGVLEMIKKCNISNYSIYFRDDVLFAYFEYTGEDYEADMKRMADDPETQRWWDVMKPMQEPFENREPGEWWSDMEEVFHLD